MAGIKGKVVLITGASEGIGRATAELFGREGARLALASRSERRLAELAESLDDVLTISADMARPEEVRHMVRYAHRHFGRLDVLINNAGQGMYRPVEEIAIEDLRHLMDVNLYGPLVAMQEAIPLMRTQGGGTIVNVSSIVSKKALPLVGGYASTKYALNALSLTARNELAGDGIVVSVVLPKATATDFPHHTIHTDDALQAVRGGLRDVDSPEKVAQRILEAAVSGEAEVYV
ncbi:MAG: SDR family NAD(P)-dependent oxidoreductase [Methanomassiliicoccus sp.]|nr:SDR family NAD(P)-dependent oxidoreductase [Methanomassiliicoccus sp.]